jgi:hypothetical protein
VYWKKQGGFLIFQTDLEKKSYAAIHLKVQGY